MPFNTKVNKPNVRIVIGKDYIKRIGFIIVLNPANIIAAINAAKNPVTSTEPKR